jgi:hypothetical protein
VAHRTLLLAQGDFKLDLDTETIEHELRSCIPVSPGPEGSTSLFWQPTES